MPLHNLYNGTLGDVPSSWKTLQDGGEAQRVEAIPSDDIPVAITAANARWTVSTTTISLAPKVPAGTEYVYLEATVADILWWDDGKDPGVTPGHILSAGFAIRLSKSQIPNFKVVRATAVDGIALLSGYKSV